MSRIGRELGMKDSSVRNAVVLISGERPMQRGMVDRVEEVFSRLAMTLPPETNQRERIAASRSRRLAKERGWLPPLALPDLGTEQAEMDDLDHAAIERRLAGDKTVRLTPGEAREVSRRWQASGRSLAELERHTGINHHRHLEKTA